MGNINSWNAKIDKTLTVQHLGKNGIFYEYILPYGASPTHYYEDAIAVKSRKRSEKYDNGKRLGAYQPIGDRRYFTFYQIRKMNKSGDWDKFLQDVIRRKQEYMIRKLEDAVVRGVWNGLQ